ncbi:MAG TPA: Clp protease N-terminal domain-containing protein [Actinophytocola sp.]|uniref:Clp protease N-terminal domain-containing protein n=1 Tax=Actinophytocola sp. TaxID=1872138 RepID=UPI002DB66390|nr:Clp protease N-terminal domain-containing protein [Actinophytocola sp.]HEU5471875.1 Clp protease N-terminal domain-containing protein [Actinophytocola sp.]
MPKINVYLPDDLAEAVREAGLPVSAICQRALEQSIRRMSAIRGIALDALGADDPTARLSQFTARARQVVRLGIDRARTELAAEVGTGHLLHGLLAEGGNLALQVLAAVEVEPERAAHELARAEPARRAPDHPATGFGSAAAGALELAVTESVALGHNYVGSEHLLLGLIAEPDGTGGRVLRGLGAELRATRRAVVAALSGYEHMRVKTGPLPMGGYGSLQARIERLEKHLGLNVNGGEATPG